LRLPRSMAIVHLHLPRPIPLAVYSELQSSRHLLERECPTIREGNDLTAWGQVERLSADSQAALSPEQCRQENQPASRCHRAWYPPMTPNKFSIEPDSGSEPRYRSDFAHRREVAFRLRWLRLPPRLQAYVHWNRLNRRIFPDVPFARHANLRSAVVKALVMWPGPRLACLCRRIICRRCHFFHEQE
jgi:hypothetical protein